MLHTAIMTEPYLFLQKTNLPFYYNRTRNYNNIFSFTIRFLLASNLVLLAFQLAHSPKRQRCMASQTVFREKSLWKPAQEYRKVNSRHTCFSRPHRQFPNGLNGEQELSPCFPTCKSSSLSSPPAGRSFLSFQQAKVVTCSSRVCKVKPFQVWRKNLPCDIRCEVFFPQNPANSKHCPFKPM